MEIAKPELAEAIANVQEIKGELKPVIKLLEILIDAIRKENDDTTINDILYNQGAIKKLIYLKDIIEGRTLTVK